uniref:Putative zinc-finger domain-containing protein n=1 Tax=Leersia perrieri TaxID=77586 RepID=A0A0D9Y0H7_9ORYZ
MRTIWSVTGFHGIDEIWVLPRRPTTPPSLSHNVSSQTSRSPAFPVTCGPHQSASLRPESSLARSSYIDRRRGTHSVGCNLHATRRLSRPAPADMSGPRPAAAAAAAAANPSASSSPSQAAHPPLPPLPPPPPPPPSRSAAAAAARVREEGEVSSGADDDEPLRPRFAAPSNVSRYADSSAQLLPANFPGKVAPSYKKTARVNQGLFKPGTNRNLSWQKPVSSDNLVITFSDDDSGSDSGKSKQDKSRGRKGSPQGTHKTGTNAHTGIMREEAQQKIHAAKVGSATANWSAAPLTLRNSGVGRGSSVTYVRRDPPVRQVTPPKAANKDGNVVGVSSTVHNLETLRHKIAARENELLKVKRPMSPGLLKDSGLPTGQTRLPSEKRGFEASSIEAYSRLNDGRPTKRLKSNQECSNNQVLVSQIPSVPTGKSLGTSNVQSSERNEHIEHGITMDCDVNEPMHAVTEPLDGHHSGATKNLSSSKMQHIVQDPDNHDTGKHPVKHAAPPTANEQSVAGDANTSVRAGSGVETSSMQVNDRMLSTWNGQHVMPADTSTVSNLRPHMRSAVENAEVNCGGQIGTTGQNTSLLSLLEMEEFQERELEDAQEHRRKCEVEEREALRAYRRAQRSLIEANEKCAILRRKREVCSAQVHGFIAENSSLAQPLSIQNAGHGPVMPSLVNSQTNADCHIPGNQGGRSGTPYPDESPQQPVDKHEARSHNFHELAFSTGDPKFASTVNINSIPSDYMEDDVPFPSSKRARSDCISNLDDHTEETIHVYRVENRQNSGESVQDYELLEASLRSRLVERFGKKPYLNNAGEATEELSFGKVSEIEHEKISAYVGPPVQEANENFMTNIEGTVELGNDGHEKGADSSNAPSIGNYDHEENTSSFGELCMPLSVTHPILPSAAPQSAARHMKWHIFPGLHKKVLDDKNDCCTSNAASVATAGVPDVAHDIAKDNAKMHPTTRKDKDIVSSGIDPFWPFCMYELRGKCNDEECPWQHVEHHSWRKSKHTKHSKSPVLGWIPHGLFLHILPVPTYRIGSNLIRADLNLIQSVLASSIWQYWQRGFCASFPLPLSVQRVLPSDAPCLQAGDDSIANFDRDRQLLNFRMLDSRKNKIVQGSVDAELFLEGALIVYFGKVNKPDRLKALLLLARAIEADPSTVILWVFYLHIYYQKDEGLGKDDMFSHAVQHNVCSYELWLMYINSRLRFDDRLDAYNDALSMLCQMTADTDVELKDRSAFILDIFLQMVYFLCMSGNVEKAISRFCGILPTATPDCCDKLLADVISCLTISDRSIFWISCLYVSIYRKLPDEIIDQLEFLKDLPHALVWSPIELTVGNRSQILVLLNYAAGQIAADINDSVKNGDPSYLRLSQFLAVNHINCLAALEGFQSCANVLVKYMEEYPMCPQILVFSARLNGMYGSCPGLKGFDELILDWPKEVQGIQYLWNQYAEHALAENIELAERVLTRWLEECEKDGGMQTDGATDAMEISNEESVQPSISSTQVGCGTLASEDQIFWLLNLSLHRMIENNLPEAKVAVDKALKLAHTGSYEHCLREHAAIHSMEKPPSSTDIQTKATFSLISGYLVDQRNLPTKELLSRRFLQNVKKHKLRQLIDDTIGPASADSSLINSVLEVCYGPSLLPEKIDEVKYLVDFVESVMEVLPANYRLALAVGKCVVKHCTGPDPTSVGTRFWASSVLINSIFRAVPVAPESVWLEGANLLEKLQAAETVKRFYQQATSVYPFSFRLWHAYLNSCKASGSSTDSIAEAARQRGIELNVAPS